MIHDYIHVYVLTFRELTKCKHTQIKTMRTVGYFFQPTCAYLIYCLVLETEYSSISSIPLQNSVNFQGLMGPELCDQFDSDDLTLRFTGVKQQLNTINRLRQRKFMINKVIS